MQSDETFENIKKALNGRSGQPIVFGVCKALAARCGCETWITRGAAIILGLVFTRPTLAAYIVLGLVLKETEVRTKGFFSGLKVMAREWSEKCIRTSRDSLHSDRYHGGYR
jgi:phage shock protein PspC (stress-responsive transcriptional regulator)